MSSVEVTWRHSRHAKKRFITNLRLTITMTLCLAFGKRVLSQRAAAAEPGEHAAVLQRHRCSFGCLSMTVIQPWNRQRLGHGTILSKRLQLRFSILHDGRGGGEMPQQQLAQTSRAS